ncbi:hypothetical protein QYF36_018067 [Acer negundo]|nr:hypothetical protein QYF36_018067 [Acer negundo]
MGSVGKNSPFEHEAGKSGKLPSTVIVINLFAKETMSVSLSSLKEKNNITNMRGIMNSETVLPLPHQLVLISTDATIVEIDGPSNSVHWVDVSGATSFELAAFELREAMEVTLE